MEKKDVLKEKDMEQVNGGFSPRLDDGDGTPTPDTGDPAPDQPSPGKSKPSPTHTVI